MDRLQTLAAVLEHAGSLIPKSRAEYIIGALLHTAAALYILADAGHTAEKFGTFASSIYKLVEQEKR